MSWQCACLPPAPRTRCPLQPRRSTRTPSAQPSSSLLFGRPAVHGAALQPQLHRSVRLRLQQTACTLATAAAPVRDADADRPPLPPADEIPEASTSGSGRSWRGSASELPTEMVTAMMAAPFAAVSLEGFAKRLADVRKQVKAVRDRVYYGDLLPPVGSQQLSYARFMELLAMKQVKRVTLMADGQVALVELPVEGWASDFASAKYDRADPTILYADERPEWQMEKYRFYVELPGDVWEDGYFMQLIKMNQVHRNAQGRRDYSNLLREGQVTTELVVMDPNDAYVWLNEYVEQFLPIVGLLLLRLLVGAGSWLAAKFGKKKKSRMEEMAEQYGRARAKAFNVGESQRQTGVRFADVAGIDAIKDEIKVIMDMLLGAREYQDIGARPFRGVLLEGPPGTGKTHLAKAMAGEAGIPFFSSNGAEFVEMFAGVAAARIRDLFAQARAFSPSIIFIDEIDAIGKARGIGGDSGTAEREQGLLQLLCEMDGFRQNDRVLVIGATNMASALDDALLRPGRFDRKIYMGRPSATNRLRILQVHARDKPIDRTNDDAVLREVADVTIGYSGAELANLLNEGAILAVRRNSAVIDLTILEEAMVKIKLGLAEAPLPDSDAKRRMAAVEAGRAVVLSLTPGIPAVQHVTIQPRGGALGRVVFQAMEFGTDGGDYHRLYYEARKPSEDGADTGELPSTFDFCCGLLVPLYAARATEVVLFGREGATLGTASEVARAGDLAQWLVQSSNLHPVFRGSALAWNMRMGGYPDPTTQGTAKQFEGFTVALQRAAYQRALATVAARRPVIETVAREMIEGNSAGEETVTGQRIRELLQQTPAEKVDHDFTTPLAGFSSLQELVADAVAEVPDQGAVGFRENGAAGAVGSVGFRRPELAADQPLQIARDQLARAARVVAGQLSVEDLSDDDANVTRSKAQIALEQVAELRRQHEERAAAVQRYGVSPDNSEPFPPPPPVLEYAGPGVEEWVRAYMPDVVEV